MSPFARLAALVSTWALAGLTLACPHVNGAGKQVDSSIAQPPPGPMPLVRYEGNWYRFAGAEILGNTHFDKDALCLRMRLCREGEWSAEAFDADEVTLNGAYLDEGYVMVQVERPIVVKPEIGDEIRLQVVIREGPRFKVSRFDVYEEGPGGSRNRLSVAYTKPDFEGNWFSLKATVAVLGPLRTAYRDLGYADVEADPQSNMDVPNKTISFEVPVKRGPLVHLSAITFVGNRTTGDELLRDRMTIKEGDLYSETKIADSKARILETGWFQSVEVSSKKSAADTLELTIEVSEKPQGVPTRRT